MLLILTSLFGGKNVTDSCLSFGLSIFFSCLTRGFNVLVQVENVDFHFEVEQLLVGFEHGLELALEVPVPDVIEDVLKTLVQPVFVLEELASALLQVHEHFFDLLVVLYSLLFVDGVGKLHVLVIQVEVQALLIGQVVHELLHLVEIEEVGFGLLAFVSPDHRDIVIKGLVVLIVFYLIQPFITFILVFKIFHSFGIKFFFWIQYFLKNLFALFPDPSNDGVGIRAVTRHPGLLPGLHFNQLHPAGRNRTILGRPDQLLLHFQTQFDFRVQFPEEKLFRSVHRVDVQEEFIPLVSNTRFAGNCGVQGGQDQSQDYWAFWEDGVLHC